MDVNNYKPSLTTSSSSLITEAEVIAAHKAWGDGLCLIAKTYEDKGYEEAKKVAALRAQKEIEKAKSAKEAEEKKAQEKVEREAKKAGEAVTNKSDDKKDLMRKIADLELAEI